MMLLIDIMISDKSARRNGVYFGKCVMFYGRLRASVKRSPVLQTM